MDLNALKDFHLIATWGGLGAASRASGKPKATLSRRLSEFEESLGVRLTERGSRSLIITEAGRQLLAQTGGPVREIEEALLMAQENTLRPRGYLRIAAPLLFSQVALGKLAARFHTLYPEIIIEAVSEDRFNDLAEEQFDVAIRINPSSNSSLVGRCFARDRQILAAAPSLERPACGITDNPEVAAIVMTSFRDGENWSLHDGQGSIKPLPVMRLSSLHAIRDATLTGAGVAMLPQSIISNQLKSGELVSWGESGTLTEIWVLHTSRRLQSPKVRAFVEFICAQYPDGWFLT